MEVKGVSKKAKEIAIREHEKVNQKYGGYLPYQYHLELVQAVAQKYIWMIPAEDRDIVLAACWLHDTLEDCHITYNDLFKELSLFFHPIVRRDSKQVRTIVDIVYAVTNEKGRNRKERANKAYYEGIKKTKYATFVKLCDRIANVLHSCMFNTRQFNMYFEENDSFKDYLDVIGMDEIFMVRDLDLLFRTRIFTFSHS